MAGWFLRLFPYVREVERRAFYDELTGALRRGRFFEILDREIKKCKRGWVQHGLVLYYIDLNKFKEVNDTYGHHVGDQYLRFVAENLRRILPKSAYLGRMGGDEFAIFDRVWPEHEFYIPKENSHRIANHLKGLAYNHEPGILIRCSVSIGYATTIQSGLDPDRLLIAADKDMYTVKRRVRKEPR